MADWIIVVDDSEDLLNVVGRLLSRNGKRVTALRSGKDFVEYIHEHGVPDLVLIDVLMPDMDGFETLMALRRYERNMGIEEVPVIFLTSRTDAQTESRGFDLGISDYIKKPLDPRVFIRRIENALHKEGRLKALKVEASTDNLTGFLNKAAVNRKLSVRMQGEDGCIMILDLDAFKLVNDLYGHVTGDEVLKAFSDILREHVPPESILGRIGGDEFLAFTSFSTEAEVAELCENLNRLLLESAIKIMGDGMDIELGVSIGALFTSSGSNELNEAYREADKALYHVKHNNKHGYRIWEEEMISSDEDEMSLAHLSAIIEERNILNHALDLNKETFIPIYRFVMRYIKRYGKSAANVLFTLELKEGADRRRRSDYMQEFSESVQHMLRKSDIITQLKSNQLLVMLTEVKRQYVDTVIEKIIYAWKKSHPDVFNITFEWEFYDFTAPETRDSSDVWVCVVDDNSSNVMQIEEVLKRDNIRTTGMCSGKELIDYLKSHRDTPDLILLDVKMPEMDGFKVMREIKRMSGRVSSVPVIFLTAAEDLQSEAKGLSLGAMDFIKKPIVPQVLLLRVRHCIELLALQRNLTIEVKKKTEENEALFFHVVQSLTDAIDAKDTYTNGHSQRVADYTREIASRYGYTEKQLSDIYVTALLHDVGKIGVPSAVINKPGRLTDEEFAIIKQHPVMGYQILNNIREMPSLSIGARWHHERYGGGGYPDGMKGEEIPEEARIIAVADAYDAMTSKRSYRDALPQEVVRSEIEKNRGTQFDPKFADIMLQMIDEDKDYNLKEQ